jgi:hypothetical protein
MVDGQSAFEKYYQKYPQIKESLSTLFKCLCRAQKNNIKISLADDAKDDRFNFPDAARKFRELPAVAAAAKQFKTRLLKSRPIPEMPFIVLQLLVYCLLLFVTLKAVYGLLESSFNICSTISE